MEQVGVMIAGENQLRINSHLLVEIHRELVRQHTVLLNRCAELRRALDHQRRTLRYVAKRLS